MQGICYIVILQFFYACLVTTFFDCAFEQKYIYICDFYIYIFFKLWFLITVYLACVHST